MCYLSYCFHGFKTIYVLIDKISILLFFNFQSHLFLSLTVAVLVLFDSYVTSLTFQKNAHVNPNSRAERQHQADIKWNDSLAEPISWIFRQLDQSYFPVFANLSPFVINNHVAFSEHKPSISSNGVDFRFREHHLKRGKNKGNFRNSKNRNSSRKIRDLRRRHSKSVRGRNKSIPMSPCPNAPIWTTIEYAERLMGGRVMVAKSFQLGSARILQYFQVARCTMGRSECRGIDKRKYRSECSHTKIWVIARVINSNGDEDWAYIAINGSCNCKLFKKTQYYL